MKLSHMRATTALGFGLAVLAPTAAGAQAEDCVERVEAIERTLGTQEGAGAPNVSHLIEAARRHAAEGRAEECLAAVRDAESFLEAAARVPETEEGGAAVRPEPPLAAGREPESRDRPEAVSPVSPPGPEGTPGAGAGTVDTLAGIPPDELPVDEIVGRPLLNNWGKDLGEIVDVVVARDNPDEIYAVVARGGDLTGGDEGLAAVGIDRLRIPHPEAVQFRVDEDAPDLDDMPAYDPSMYRSLTRRGQQQPTGGGG